MSYGRNGEGYQSSSGFGSMGYGYQGGTSFADPTSVMQNWGASSRSAGGGKGLVDSYIADKTSALTKTAQTGAFTALGAGALAGGSSIASVGSTVAGAIGISAGASSAILGVGALAVAGGATAVGLKLAGPTIIKGGTSSLKWSINKIKTKISGKSNNDEFDKESSKAVGETNATYDENATTKSTKLDEKEAQIAKREEKFNSLVSKQRDNLKEGKGDSGEIKDLYNLRTPTKKAKEELNKLTADYIIGESTKEDDYGGKFLDLGALKNNTNDFVKSFNRHGKKRITNAVKDRIEEYKNDLKLDIHNKFIGEEKKPENEEKKPENEEEIDKKFNSLVSKQRDNLKEGKGEDVRSSLKEMYNLKLSSKNTKTLHKLTADYIIKSSAVGKIGEDGGVEMRERKAEARNIDSFAKEAKLVFSQKQEITNAVSERVEEHRNNLDLDKNDKFVSLEKNRGTAKKTAKAKAQVDKEKVEKIKADKTNESKAQKKTTPSKAPTKAPAVGKEQGR